ncbi:L-lactate permease [Streptomyces meridianus]|uniref:L-lactate permease n=1 Tax=Streptomyces meridianus TaxID=2938945 RepID=A0ABT0X8N8_9ACTN|nr:L-lactate permease [Streptomyces meridianus]MCM2578283.1 L-lactate permease [Streptomyces meridianus]
MFRPVLDPVIDSLAWSALVAAVPLLVFFVLLGLVRLKASWAALASLAASVLVAIGVYAMPAGQALSSAAEGALFGLFPIMWIVVNALWIYQITVDTGHFEVLRRSFGRLSDDQRLQAIIVAFCFGALLEALAGFGAPVAISSVMLIALGFRPFKAATVALVANTAPVAFGAMGTPVITLAKLTGLSLDDVASTVGRQTPVLAAVVPLLLVFLVDGRRGLRQTWLPALVTGVTFGVAQFVTANYISVELTDVVAALISVGALVLLMRVLPGGGVSGASRTPPLIAGGSEDAEPAQAERAERDARDAREEVAEERGAVVKAYLPYAVVIAVFAVTQLPPVKALLAHGTVVFDWPGLDVADPVTGEPVAASAFTFNWLPATGTMLLLSGVITVALLGVRPSAAVRAYGSTLRQLASAILTVAAVLALAYVMNLSGQTTTIGHWIAGAGAGLAFLSPVLGWLGVAVSGSDTSSNALFGALQVAAAKSSGFSPELLASANSSGGVLGKMISPQNLAIAAAATGLGGREPELLRKVVVWSLLLLLLICILVALQATPVLAWMLPT